MLYLVQIVGEVKTDMDARELYHDIKLKAKNLKLDKLIELKVNIVNEA